MTEVEDRRFIRYRGASQIDAHKAAQHRRFLQRIFDRWVRDGEPVLLGPGSMHVAHTPDEKLAKRELALRLRGVGWCGNLLDAGRTGYF